MIALVECTAHVSVCLLGTLHLVILHDLAPAVTPEAFLTPNAGLAVGARGLATPVTIRSALRSEASVVAGDAMRSSLVGAATLAAQILRQHAPTLRSAARCAAAAAAMQLAGGSAAAFMQHVARGRLATAANSLLSSSRTFARVLAVLAGRGMLSRGHLPQVLAALHVSDLLEEAAA